MKKNRKGQFFNRVRLTVMCLAMISGPGLSASGATITWNGGGTTANWSDTNNWGGLALTNGNALIFAGTVGQTNYNDLSDLSLGAVAFSSSGWNISGNPVTLTASGFTNSVASSSSTWGLDSTLNAQVSITQASTTSKLFLTGVLSGTGGITKTAGGNGTGQLYLVNTNNSFTGPVNISGPLFFYSMAPGGQNSSLGAGTNVISLGAANTSYAGSMTFLGTNSCITDRSLKMQSQTTSPLSISNSSPDNSSLTFNGTNNIFSEGTSADVFVTTFGGTSTGTNTFNGPLGGFSTITPIQSQWAGSLQIYGPGTWVFNEPINVNGALTVSGDGRFVLGYEDIYDSDPLSVTLTIASGSTLDVSAFDRGGAMFTLGANAGVPQTLTAGRAGGTQATDINGSLSLAGTAGATLNVAANGTAGTLTISSNFVPASSTINFDLNTTNTAGSGSNDLIVVNGNLDLSQGTAQIKVNLLRGSLLTNTPYTLFTYTGTLTGNVSGLTVPAPSIAYLAGVVDVTSVPGQVLVTFPSSGLSAANLIWQGNVNDDWDINVSQNWLNGASAAYFVNGNSVTFNDSSSQPAVSLVGSLIPTLVTVSNMVNGYVFSGNGSISGGSLLKQGAGTVTVATADTYAGSTDVSAGTVVVENVSALSTSPVELGDTNSGTNAISLLVSSLANDFSNSIVVVSNGTGTVTIGNYDNNVTFDSPVTIQRNLIINCDNTNANSFTMQGGLTGSGNVTVTGGGSVKWQNITGTFTNPFNFSGNLFLTPGTNGNTTYLGMNQFAATVNTNMNVTLAGNTQLGIISSAPINALNGSGQVIAGLGIASGSTFIPILIIGSGNGSGTFSGIISSNPTSYTPSILKNGTGTEVFTGDFTGASTDDPVNTGGTGINAGTLAINNLTGTGLNPCGVFVATNGTLAGNGSIDESTNGITVDGTLSIGNAGDISGQHFTIFGTTARGALVITNGAILAVDLFSGAGDGDNTGIPAAADFLNAQTQVIITNASLTVSNPDNLTNWAAGDKWKIINYGSPVTGTFTGFHFPPLPATLAWDTSLLYTSGVIDIITNPVLTQAASFITGISIANGNIILTGTNLNDGAGFHYIVLSSTNLTTPLTNWTLLSTNSFNVDGSFNSTNAINATAPAMFFDVKITQ